MKILVVRDDFTEKRTLGKIFVDGELIGQTCEDTDRKLEDGENEKIAGETAIPRGLYKVVLSHSSHFGKVLPELLNVPGYSGVRIHGGNSAADTLGCILVGRVRMANGIANCAATVQRIIDMIDSAEEHGEIVTLEVC